MSWCAYYNEIEPYAAQWLRNLIQAGHIAAGEVDERSIEDVHPNDIRGFTQCHFFAGIGIWSHALRNAGWPDDRPVWTGSCPCQPFSQAGEGAGFADERHLWPAWHHLIKECRPPGVFGEQVASKNVDPWVDLVQTDLEAMGYAFGAIAFPAAGVGAPHIRDRLYFVAQSSGERWSWWQRASSRGQPDREDAGRVEGDDGLARADEAGLRMANSSSAGLEVFGEQPARQEFETAERGGEACELERSPVRGFWAGADWLSCRDGKSRPVEPGTCPLAHGTAGRVGRLRAYGNGICAPQARVFIEEAMRCMP